MILLLILKNSSRRLKPLFLGVTEKAVNSSFKDIKTLIIEANDQIAEMANRGEVLQGVPTGFKDVDQLFNGLRGGQLIILAARPGVGKSSFAMNLAVNAAKQKSTVAFFSLEMSSVEITKRLLSAESGINLSVFEQWTDRQQCMGAALRCV